MNTERAAGAQESKYPESLDKFRSHEAARKLARWGLTVLAMTGVVMNYDHDEKNDLAALGLTLACLGTALYLDKRSDLEFDGLFNSAEKKDSDSGK